MRLTTPLAAASAALMLFAADTRAARKPASLPASSAPAWVRDAAASTVPGDVSGLDAVTLLDEWIARPLAAGGVSVTHRQVVRVMRPEGLGHASSLAETYREDDRIEALDAWNLLPDGTLRQPHAKDDVADIPYTLAGSTVDDVRLRVLSVPAVVVGSVVAFNSTVTRAIDGGALDVTFGDEDGPVGACRLSVEAPAGWLAGGHGVHAEGFTRADTPGGVAWSAPSVPRPAIEDFAPDAGERLPRLLVTWRSPDGARGFESWDDVAAWYRALADPVLKDADDVAALAGGWKPKDAAGLEDAFRAAFTFASRDIRYVAIQMGIGGYRPQSPAFTCRNRYGDCKAKSFVLRSIVEPWGWTVHPVLVRTRDLGPVMREVPTPGQFNHLIAGLVLPDGLGAGAWNVVDVEGIGRVAFVDPTTTDLGPWQLRTDDQATTGLLVLPRGSRLVELPVQPPEASVTTIRLDATLDERGNATSGVLHESYSGTRAGAVRGWYSGLRAEQVRSAAVETLQRWVPGASLIDHSLEGLASLDGDVVERTSFTGGRLGQRAGELLIVQPPSLSLPLPAARLGPPPRTTPLELGLPEERRVEVSITVPAGWQPESLPEPARHEAPQFALACTWERTEAGFRIAGTGRQLVREVSPADYPAFRAAARAAASAESEGVVLVRTSSDP